MRGIIAKLLWQNRLSSIHFVISINFLFTRTMICCKGCEGFFSTTITIENIECECKGSRWQVSFQIYSPKLHLIHYLDRKADIMNYGNYRDNWLMKHAVSGVGLIVHSAEMEIISNSDQYYTQNEYGNVLLWYIISALAPILGNVLLWYWIRCVFFCDLLLSGSSALGHLWLFWRLNDGTFM